MTKWTNNKPWSVVAQAVKNLDDSYFSKVAEASNAYHSTEMRGADRLFDRIFVGLEGDFAHSSVTPRTLTAEHLCHLVAVDGIVTRCSLVRPKVARSVHFCPATVRSLPSCGHPVRR